jgi:trans-aconitate 2-methyltransferase
MAHTWDPGTYLEYGDERARPFVDLVARVGATDPRSVVDLGCGPGHLTALLRRRWPAADVVGVDSSAEMVAAAEPGSGVRMVVGDLREWAPTSPVDVLVSNAALQWVPDHLALLPRLVDQVAPGGWFAFQVPGNFAAPSHALRRRLEEDPRFAPYLEGVAGPDAHDPGVYLEALLDRGCEVDAWETTYLHVLAGDDPVFTWAVGTGARPTLEALPDGPRQEFEGEFRRALRDAYPSTRHGTVLPFRRVFVVARRAGSTAP